MDDMVRFTGPDADGEYWLHIGRLDGGASGFNLGQPMSDASRESLDKLVASSPAAPTRGDAP